MPESDQERQRLAEQVAYQQGVRDNDVDSRLRSHENRLNAINGSIEKHARETAKLEKSIGGLADKLDDVMASLETKAAVEADRVRQIKQANDKQISNKTFWLGVVVIIATLIAPIIARGGF